MAKPRTNYDAAQYWADSILTNEPAPALDVNSVQISRDAIYSFGHHYPMGKIFRNEDGSVRRVVLTSDYYPSRGFASTPTDQGNVHACAAEAVSKLRNVELEFAPLSDYKFKSGIPCKPKASDPPLERPYIEVPRVFHASDPGPEPVKTGEGCVAGTFEEYSYQSDRHVFLDLAIDLPKAWEWTFARHYTIGADEQPRVSIYKRTMHNGFIYHGVNQHSGPWGAPLDEQWADFQSTHPGADVHYVQCEHCAAFDKLHARWHGLYHGAGYGNRRQQGWRLYCEMLETYGSVEDWREAYREEWRRVRNGRKYIEGWIERNFIPLTAVSHDSDGIPILDENGHAMRKDSEAYFKKQRRAERARRRLEREAEDNARLRRRARRVIERRERRRAETFIGRADRVANELRTLRLELESSRSTESPGGTA